MKTIQPRDAKDMIETLTLSFGKHQASEKQGTLYALLRAYVNRQDDPAPHAGLASEAWRHLRLFGEGGKVYCGGPLQRADFRNLLKSVAMDPAMERTQDAFFEQPEPDIRTELLAWATDFHARNGRIPSYFDRERWFLERIETLQKQLGDCVMATSQRCMAIAGGVHAEHKALWNVKRSHSYEYDRSVGAQLVWLRIRQEFPEAKQLHPDCGGTLGYTPELSAVFCSKCGELPITPDQRDSIRKSLGLAPL